MRQFFSLMIVFTMICTMFSSDAEARRRRRRRAPRAKIINEKKLYERLGGAKGVSSVVDEWLRLNLADQRVSGFFSTYTAKPERLGKLRHRLNDQICEIADGPCVDKSSDTQHVRDVVGINDDQFLVLSDNLVHSLEKYDVAEREKNELLSRLGDLQPDILGQPH